MLFFYKGNFSAMQQFFLCQFEVRIVMKMNEHFQAKFMSFILYSISAHKLNYLHMKLLFISRWLAIKCLLFNKMLLRQTVCDLIWSTNNEIVETFPAFNEHLFLLLFDNVFLFEFDFNEVPKNQNRNLKPKGNIEENINRNLRN